MNCKRRTHGAEIFDGPQEKDGREEFSVRSDGNVVPDRRQRVPAAADSARTWTNDCSRAFVRKSRGDGGMRDEENELEVPAMRKYRLERLLI